MAKYRHDWDVGQLSLTCTALKGMAILQSDPNAIFPFLVRGQAGEKDIRLGSSYDLVNTTGPLDSLGTGPDPVRVTAVSPKAFTFLTLAGHHRGAGQTISFETYEKPLLEDDVMEMHVFLAQYGTYVSSFHHPFSTLFNWGANLGAGGAWALQAHNMRVALGTAGSFESTVLPGPRNVFPGT
jgi:hypothetical protein